MKVLDRRVGNRMVQLAGLEPATSCSTNRRSNQLSYNCILTGPEQGAANSRETRCNAVLWQGRQAAENDESWPLFATIIAGKQKPGLAARAFGSWQAQSAQAAGWNSFEAPVLIGSAVSVTIF